MELCRQTDRHSLHEWVTSPSRRVDFDGGFDFCEDLRPTSSNEDKVKYEPSVQSFP